MGNSLPNCSCIKGGNEEKKSEFLPGSVNYINTTDTNYLLNKEIKESTVTSPKPKEKKLDLKLTKNTTFSFRYLEKAKTLNPGEIKKIQTIYRAFIFRKKFLKNKESLKKSSDEYINKKETEYISEKLMETDKIMKKEFNDDFLEKLQLKESSQGITPLKRKIKTDCLIRKDSKGEDYLYRGDLDLEGKFNGYGELFLKNGKKYEGKFIDGKLNGFGRLIDLFGIKCYEGKFKDNQLMDGKGKIIEIGEDGSRTVHEGDIKNMKKEGNGIEIKKDYTYMGQFSNDVKHGHGKAIFNDDETVYEGDFINGQMKGIGIYHWKNKNTYEGEILNGKMHGKGKYIWADGSKYEGNYVNNKREGFGEYTKKSGKKYRGYYKGGKKHGKGVIINPNGEQKEVEYYEDQIIKKRNNAENDLISNDFQKSSREFTLK